MIHRGASFKYFFLLSAESYSQVPPQTTIRSDQLSATQNHQLMEAVLEKASTMAGQAMLDALVAFAISEGEGMSVEEEAAVKPKAQRTKNKKRTKKKTEDKPVSSKLPSLRTAEDVISRICWDADLDKEAFTVGYLDRFLGVVEKEFHLLSWEDIASVDYNTLAIPKHRIQYFKYKKMKVWDKNERLDYVFGSCGSEKTIQDVSGTMLKWRKKLLRMMKCQLWIQAVMTMMTLLLPLDVRVQTQTSLLGKSTGGKSYDPHISWLCGSPILPSMQLSLKFNATCWTWSVTMPMESFHVNVCISHCAAWGWILMSRFGELLPSWKP
jgi:uncharacterized protein (UPF0248 family)